MQFYSNFLFCRASRNTAVIFYLHHINYYLMKQAIRMNTVWMKSFMNAVVLLLALSCSFQSKADDDTADEYHNSAVGIDVGTTGIGLDYLHALWPGWHLRLGFDALTLNDNQDSSGTVYNGNLNLLTIHSLIDWYPEGSGLRLTGGLVWNDNSISLSATPDASNGNGGYSEYTLNGNTYSSDQITGINAHVSFQRLVPYFGIGYGNPLAARGHLGMTADLGVMYQGNADENLSVTCAAGLDTGTCSQIQNDAAAQRANDQNNLSRFGFYPRLSVSLFYLF